MYCRYGTTSAVVRAVVHATGCTPLVQSAVYSAGRSVHVPLTDSCRGTRPTQHFTFPAVRSRAVTRRPGSPLGLLARWPPGPIDCCGASTRPGPRAHAPPRSRPRLNSPHLRTYPPVAPRLRGFQLRRNRGNAVVTCDVWPCHGLLSRDVAAARARRTSRRRLERLERIGASETRKRKPAGVCIVQIPAA